MFKMRLVHLFTFILNLTPFENEVNILKADVITQNIAQFKMYAKAPQ